MPYRSSIAIFALTVSASAATNPKAAEVPATTTASAGDSARTVQYHAQDIVPIHAKVKFTTLIVVPPTEKIMKAATGDKDFWIVDVVGNFCFVHPAKQGISSNINLITDKGNIYSFTLQDVSGTGAAPDLKVMIELQRINQALLLILRTQQDQSQLAQGQTLEQMVAQKQQQDELKMLFQGAQDYETNYNSKVSTSAASVNRILHY